MRSKTLIPSIEFFSQQSRRQKSNDVFVDGTCFKNHGDFDRDKGTVDGSEIPARKPPFGSTKPVVRNGRNYQPQLVKAGFLNHQK